MRCCSLNLPLPVDANRALPFSMQFGGAKAPKPGMSVPLSGFFCSAAASSFNSYVLPCRPRRCAMWSVVASSQPCSSRFWQSLKRLSLRTRAVCKSFGWQPAQSRLPNQAVRVCKRSRALVQRRRKVCDVVRFASVVVLLSAAPGSLPGWCPRLRWPCSNRSAGKSCVWQPAQSRLPSQAFSVPLSGIFCSAAARQFNSGTSFQLLKKESDMAAEQFHSPSSCQPCSPTSSKPQTRHCQFRLFAS